MVFGGADKKTTITNVGIMAFAKMSSLKKLTFYNSADIQFGANLFMNGRVPDEIVFTGPAFGAEAFATLLAEAVAADTKPVKVYVSRLMPGWPSTSYIDYSPTAAERAEAPGEEVIGVYRGGATAPAGKALVIQRPGPFEPHGTVLFIR